MLSRISLAHSENIDFFGSMGVDIEGELAQVGPTGYGPLRVRHPLMCEGGGSLLRTPVTPVYGKSRAAQAQEHLPEVVATSLFLLSLELGDQDVVAGSRSALPIFRPGSTLADSRMAP